MQKRKIPLRIGDFIVTGIVLLTAGVIVAVLTGISSRADNYLVIKQDGKVIETVSLEDGVQQTIKVDGAYHNTIEVKDGQVRFASSDCPNQHCVHSGWVSRSYQTAACLPNQVIIEIHSSESGQVDAVS